MSLTYAAGLRALAAGTLDFLADTMEILLVQASYTPAADDTSAVYAAAELPTYAGGFGGADRKVLDGKTATPDAATQQILVQAANPTPWLLGSGAEVGGAIIGKRGDTSDETAIPLFFVDVEGISAMWKTVSVTLRPITIGFAPVDPEPPVEPPIEPVEPPVEPPIEPVDGANLVVGTVTEDGQPSGGGTIELFDGETLVASVAVAEDGTFALENLTPGPRTVQFSPDYTKSHLSHPDGRQAVTIGDEPAIADYTVQSAYGAYDFAEDLIDDAALRSTSTPPGPGSPLSVLPNCDAINYNDGGGYGDISVVLVEGKKTMRQHWRAGGNGLAYDTPGGASSLYVKLDGRANPLPGAGQRDFWVGWEDRLSIPFVTGGNGATGSAAEYKYLFIDVHDGRGIQMEMENRNGGAPDDLQGMRLKMVGGTDNGAVSDGIYPANGVQAPDYMPERGAFLGAWQAWHIHIGGLGTGTQTCTLYHKGVPRISLTSSGWLAGSRSLYLDSIVTLELGANINNGPEVEQFRWWRKLAIYKSQPSLLNPLAP